MPESKRERQLDRKEPWDLCPGALALVGTRIFCSPGLAAREVGSAAAASQAGGAVMAGSDSGLRCLAF